LHRLRGIYQSERLGRSESREWGGGGRKRKTTKTEGKKKENPDAKRTQAKKKRPFQVRGKNQTAPNDEVHKEEIYQTSPSRGKKGGKAEARKIRKVQESK